MISKEFAEKHQISREKCNLNAELWDGTLVPMGRCSENLNLEISSVKITIRPYIGDLNSYDMILGKSWFAYANPMIDSKIANRLFLHQKGEVIALDAEACESRH